MASRRRRLATLLLATAIAALVLACDSESVITVENTTTTQLRVFVKVPGGGIDSVTPTAGEHSSVTVPDAGNFYAFATVDSDWLETVRIKRDALNAKVSNPDSLRSLSQDDLAEILQTINDLNREINRVQDHPWDQVGGCTGQTDTSGGGKITITDNPAGGFPSYLLLCD
ncbi:MAG: hypothetical protein QFC55_01760 [Chloroflexota bacterium]|nr:hypothetical protein [Chloroflexota bacterium]